MLEHLFKEKNELRKVAKAQTVCNHIFVVVF